MQLLRTHPTDWNPSSAKVTLNVCTEACIVPSDEESARLSYGHVVVLDDFITDSIRKELFESINLPDWRETDDPLPTKWRKETYDVVGQSPSWGLSVGLRIEAMMRMHGMFVG